MLEKTVILSAKIADISETLSVTTYRFFKLHMSLYSTLLQILQKNIYVRVIF